MHKKTITLAETDHGGWTWGPPPGFIPPAKEITPAHRLTPESATPRVGELKTLLETSLETLIGTVGATAGVVRLLSPDGHTLQVISSAGLSAELQQEAENFVELDCEAQVNAGLRHIVHVSDISACDSRQNCRYASCRFQSLIASPIEAHSTPGTPFGILTVFFDVPRELAGRSREVVAAFAEVMGATIEHTRINREIKRIERLSARQGMANDIHDTLAQPLIYARMRVSVLLEAIRSGNQEMALRYANDLDEALEMGQKSARTLITDFRGKIDAGGLLTALNDLTAEFSERNNIVLEYRNRIVDLALPLEFEIQVHHIVREALTNVARHSGATHARLCVDACSGYFVFTVEDNGSGARTFTPVEGHYGIMIMQERAQRIGGEIRVDSTVGSGTRVQLYFPEPSLDWRVTNE
ncbi:MAG: GAF domain-containing protein [Nitrosomonadales bacterium]|nr:GAF domain-containing protein [Nitrosomonadales bacterium]